MRALHCLRAATRQPRHRAAWTLLTGQSTRATERALRLSHRPRQRPPFRPRQVCPPAVNRACHCWRHDPPTYGAHGSLPITQNTSKAAIGSFLMAGLGTGCACLCGAATSRPTLAPTTSTPTNTTSAPTMCAAPSCRPSVLRRDIRWRDGLPTDVCLRRKSHASVGPRAAPVCGRNVQLGVLCNARHSAHSSEQHRTCQLATQAGSHRSGCAPLLARTGGRRAARQRCHRRPCPLWHPPPRPHSRQLRHPTGVSDRDRPLCTPTANTRTQR